MDQYTGQGETDFQAPYIQKQFRYKSGISGTLEWERVNEITWKLTNGEQINTPASHGQWPGFRTSKAVAWVIDVSPTAKHNAAWLARCRDQCCGSLPLKEAKAAAMAMAKGAVGNYYISRPTAELNGRTAILHDREPSKGEE